MADKAGSRSGKTQVFLRRGEEKVDWMSGVRLAANPSHAVSNPLKQLINSLNLHDRERTPLHDKRLL